MNYIEQIPALIRVIAVFIIILFTIRRKIFLGNSFLIGALLLSIFFSLSPLSAIKSIAGTIIDAKVLSLTVIVCLILTLSTCMEETGQMQRMLNSFSGLLSSQRLNLIIFPALIGLLPMPGGAVFSAPMVKELSSRHKLDGGSLSFINYWFRHIWEYWWPLYPGVLLVAVMADINLAKFIFYMLPLTLIAILIGYSKLKYLGIHQIIEPEKNEKNAGLFIKELMPIIIVIIPGLGAGVALDKFFPHLKIGKEIGLILSLFASIIWMVGYNKITAAQMKKVIFSSNLAKMIYLIFAIFCFKGILEDSHAVNMISRELLVLKIPVFVIAVLLPFLVGTITGITVAFVGSTLPILIALIVSLNQTHLMIPYMMLALTSGFAGVLLSPVHLCFILSNEFFDTEMNKVYSHLWIPVMGITFFGIFYTRVILLFLT